MINPKKTAHNFIQRTNFATMLIIIIYIVAKLTFSLIMTHQEHWLLKFISIPVIVYLAMAISYNIKLDKRAAAAVVPFIMALAESIVTAFTGGDSVYFIFLTITSALSFIYLDNIGLLIHIALTNIVCVAFVFGFKFPMMGTHYVEYDCLINFVYFNVMNIILFCISIFSVGRYKGFEMTSRTFDTIMKTTPNFMIVSDNNANVRYISTSLVKRLGIGDVKYAKNRPILDLLGTHDVKMMFFEALESDGFVTREFEIHGSETRWFILRSALMESGKSARLFEWMEVTQIMEAKNEAELAARAKTEFLARMSHEIRTPMNAITGMSELILREDIPATIYENTMSIKQASANLLSLINDILDFSKIESGKMEIVNAEYIFASLIHDVIMIIRMRMIDKPVLFTVNIDSYIPNKLIGDESRIRQILLNLLVNAVKYTEKGFISVTISGEIIEDIVKLELVVADSGIGIKEEDIKNLFGDFVQFDKLRNRDIQGTGLGLAITKSLCHAMKGDILVQSDYGKGSVFTASIPQVFKKYERFAEVFNPAEKQVLIYETRSIYASSIEESIKNLGVECVTVNTRSAFLEEIKRLEYLFIFVSSILFESARSIVDGLGVKSQLVLMTEFGDAVAAHGVKIVSMPIHALAIANILNDVADDSIYGGSDESYERFIAPTAQILIVDDIRTNLRVAEGLMAPYRMTVHTCLSGMEALQLVKDKSYDIIFMDHMMPEMDGLEATERIRALDDGEGYYRNLPIIALTANAISGIKEMFLKNGLNDFLAKPIETSKLNAMLEKWIPKDKKEKVTDEKISTEGDTIEIKGINVKVGISMTGGTLDNYLKTLAIFYEDGMEKINQLKACLQNTDDVYMYTTFVHALKSALASIGAEDISNYARELEAAGKNENIPFIKKNTNDFLDKLYELLKAIEVVISKKEAENDIPVNSGESELIKADLKKIKEALEIFDVRTIDEILERLESEKWDNRTQNLIDSISRFMLLSEYDEALVAINEFLG